MNKFHSEDAIRVYLLSQTQLREQAHPGTQSIIPRFVTVSRETGAGGVAVAELLAEQLNGEDEKGLRVPWTVFDKNLVEVVRREHDLPERFSKVLDESAFPEYRGIMDDLFGIKPSMSTMMRKTAQTILRLAALGNAIFVGRGANVITRGLEGGLHVRLIAPLALRINRIMDRESLERAEAEEFVKKSDEGKRRFMKDHFDRDISDQLLHHVALNTGRVTLPQAVTAIRSLLEHPG
jgi:Cytidylate kinase-like family